MPSHTSKIADTQKLGKHMHRVAHLYIPNLCYKYGELVSNNLNEYIVAILWWMSLKFSGLSKGR